MNCPVRKDLVLLGSQEELVSIAAPRATGAMARAGPSIAACGCEVRNDAGDNEMAERVGAESAQLID
jgi:hypothetical protein